MVIVLLGLVIYCIYRFYKKKRINDKAEKNKKNFEDEEVLVFAEEEVDMLEEEAAKVGFWFKILFSSNLEGNSLFSPGDFIFC